MLKRIFGYVMDSVETVVFILSLYIVVYIFLFMPSEVRGASMEPTLHSKEKLIINKLIYHLHPPQRGDIVILKSPRNPDASYIKRVIAASGDTVRIEKGIVFVNGEGLNEQFVSSETYAFAGGALEEGKDYLVPEDSVFVLGDNRNRSSDSRDFGFVPVSSIEGEAIFRYYPPDKIGFLNNPYKELVTGPGVEPGLGDYEPPVQPYTTP